MFATSDRFKLLVALSITQSSTNSTDIKNIPRRNKSDKLFQSSSSQRGIPLIYMYRGRQWLTQMADKSNESSGRTALTSTSSSPLWRVFRGLLLSFLPSRWLRALLPQMRQTLLGWLPPPAPPPHLPAAAGKAGRAEAQHFGVCLSSQRNSAPGRWGAAVGRERQPPSRLGNKMMTSPKGSRDVVKSLGGSYI